MDPRDYLWCSTAYTTSFADEREEKALDEAVMSMVVKCAENYKQCEPVFDSVISRNERCQGDALYFKSLCMAFDTISFELLPSNINPLEVAAAGIAKIATDVDTSQYEGFTAVAVYQAFTLLHTALSLRSLFSQQSIQQLNSRQAQMQMAADTGVPLNIVSNAMKQNIGTFQKRRQVAEAQTKFAYAYARMVALSLAKNMRDPEKTKKSVMGYLDELCSTIDKSTVNHGLPVDTKSSADRFLRSNRASASRRAAEEARKKRESEEKEAERRKNQRELAVAAWWESHPKEKAELVARIADLETQIADANQEIEGLKKRRQEAICERDVESEAETELDEASTKLVELKHRLSAVEARKIPPTSTEIDRNVANSRLSSKRSELDHLSAKVISVKDSELVSGKMRDGLVSEIDSLEQELASLGAFSWGKKRRLSDLIARKKTELDEAKTRLEQERSMETARLEQERADAIVSLQDEIASLEAEVAELEPLVAEERATAEAEKVRDIEEAKAKVAEFELIVGEILGRAAAEKEARDNRLQPVFDEVNRALPAIEKKVASLQKLLKLAKNELAFPAMPQEFLASFE